MTSPDPSAPPPSPYGPPPGYGSAPGYGSTPGYGSAPGYGTAPGYGGAPGYGTPPGYGSAPGYGAPAGYGSAPGYGTPPGYGAGVPPLASWGSRVGASLLDALCVVGVILVSGIVGGLLSTASDALGAAVLVLGYLAGIGFAFWQLAVQGRTGQTIGKRTVGLRLLREQDGQVVGPGLSIARYFVHVLDSWSLGLGYLWPLWDAKRQTFADKVMKTVVVRA